MRGQRSARSRAPGSWAPRLAGTGFAILLAGAGLAAYLIVGGAHASQDAAVLPTRVLGTQAIGLVNPGPPAGGTPATETLLATRSGLTFRVVGQVGADWTADQMAGGTYIFIYLPNGLCLASAEASSRPSAVALARCNLEAGQRWRRLHLVVAAGGLDYWQLSNLADGRCLTAAGSAARLEPCQASPGWRQQVAFLTAS
jgi:Ricin-type beta-trefoil lectin domain-like